MRRIVVTNDDGIDSAGIHALVSACSSVGEVYVIAPDRNRSAVSRGITLGQQLMVEERSVPGATVAYSCDGTPTDCVRFASLGLFGDEKPDVIVSGANHGLNLGDDVTFSGTVAAAFEGALTGLPAIAVSQQSEQGELGYPRDAEFDFSTMCAVMPRIIEQALLGGFDPGVVLNVNVPSRPVADIERIEITKLGRRIYRDRLELQHEDGDRRRFSIYGDDPSHHDEEGTDIAALGRGNVSITPIRYDLTCDEGMQMLATWPLDRVLEGSPS